jgi:hypothetical protein
VYDPLSGVCLSVDGNFKPYAIFAIPLVFDVIIIVLTTVKTYRLAAAVRKESGAVIVRPTLTHPSSFSRYCADS